MRSGNAWRATTASPRVPSGRYAPRLERQSVHLTTHAHQHRQRQDEVDARRPGRNLARRSLLIVGRRYDAENFLLVRPDENPTIEQHDGAEPCADADRTHSRLQRERLENAAQVALS